MGADLDQMARDLLAHFVLHQQGEFIRLEHPLNTGVVVDQNQAVILDGEVRLDVELLDGKEHYGGRGHGL